MINLCMNSSNLIEGLKPNHLCEKSRKICKKLRWYAKIIKNRYCKCMHAFQTLVGARGVISTFSWGPNFFYIFQCHRTIEKLKKQHFICSNLTLFIVPFFLSFFLFFLFSPFLFFLFSFFFSFFLFPWGVFPSPPQMTPLVGASNLCYPGAILFTCFRPLGTLTLVIM